MPPKKKRGGVSAPPETAPINTEPAFTDTKPVKKSSEATSAPRQNRKPKQLDVKLSARQYIRARGYKWERCGGFLHDMKSLHAGNKTRPEWDQLWDAFWARPVR